MLLNSNRPIEVSNGLLANSSYFSFSFFTRNNSGHPVTPQHNIKKFGADDRIAAARLQNVFVGRHYFPRFQLRFFGQWHMNGHLVTVKVGVESVTNQRVNLDSATLNQNRSKRLNAESVQSRRPVEQNIFVLNYFLQNRPDLRNIIFN